MLLCSKEVPLTINSAYYGVINRELQGLTIDSLALSDVMYTYK